MCDSFRYCKIRIIFLNLQLTLRYSAAPRQLEQAPLRSACTSFATRVAILRRVLHHNLKQRTEDNVIINIMFNNFKFSST